MPAIEIIEEAIPECLVLRGDTGAFEMPAGKILKIETTPSGEELLTRTVPAGKKWRVVVSVRIEEMDV